MILAIETSATHASLAVASGEDGTLLSEKKFVTNRAHNAVIFEPLGELLESYRDELSGIVVGLGPGSYSGIRVGIAVGNGLALSMGLPVIGLSSLEAWTASSGDYLVVGDARRRSFFLAEVNDRQCVGEPRLVEADNLDEALQSYCQSEIEMVTADATVHSRIPRAILSYPDASILAGNAARLPRDAWEESQILEPHYLRAPYITTPKKAGKS